MESSDPSGRLTVEDLSDCKSESSHSETQLRAFQDYERIKELNLSVEKSKEDLPTEPKDFHLGLEPGRTPIRFQEFENAARSLPMTLNKGKDFGYIASNMNEMTYPPDRSNENDDSVDTSNLCRPKNPTAKDLLFNLRDSRQKNTHAALSLDRYGKDLNFAMSEKDIKDFGLLKNYNLDRMKEFNLSLDRMRDGHIGNFALERLRGGAGLMENPGMLEHNEFKNIQVQPRNQNLEAIALERMRRSHMLGTDLTAQNLSSQLPHPHSITQMQHSQQQQQQQAKSFTIDAILGLRNNPREKRGQQQQYKKHQGQEGGTKNGSSSSCSGGGGKLKRVRTIFTAEQLERLEGEFARQQYMVGPERLYLAHALRLTEAQVKVWFQNRRIKWRKHHHEQQSQRVHEFQRTLNSSLEHEDSNEADKWCQIASARFAIMKHVEYKSKCPPHAFSESRDPADAYSKHSQRKSQSVAFDRSCRSPETVASYYASATSYKPQKGYAGPSPTYSKYPSPHSPEMSHHGLQSHSKLCRDKHYPPNFSTVRKNRYGDEFGDSEKLKYVEEKLENFTDDNGEEEEAEEEEDVHEEPGDYLIKDYEEQEADDEIDEESDISPQTHRAPREGKKEALLREQRWRAMEQQETRRLRCQQRGAMGQGHTSPSRYYHDAVDHEVPEPLSEEDFVPTSLKNSSRRPATDYHQWPQSRSESDRYDAAALPMPLSRRARTKPEIDHLIEVEFSKTRKCNRCGSLSNKKSDSPTKNCCRFDDRASFPTKGPIGDEPESHEQQFCGRYISRHSSKDANGATNIPTPLYSSKSRRSRDLKSPTIYEIPEQMEKLPDYSRSSPRYHRKVADVYPEKTKCSLHTSHGLPRISSRYEE